jgi:hypothetical protein
MSTISAPPAEKMTLRLKPTISVIRTSIGNSAIKKSISIQYSCSGLITAMQQRFCGTIEPVKCQKYKNNPALRF